MELPRGKLATPYLLITITPPTLGRSYYIARSLCYRSVKFQTLAPHDRPIFSSKIMSYKIGHIFFSQDPPFPCFKRRDDMWQES